MGLHNNSSSSRDAPSTAGITINRARIYDLGRAMLFGLDRRLWRMLLELAQVVSGETVLDVGCGTGALALDAARVVGSSGAVYGIDAAPEMIALAQRKASRSRSGVSFQVGLIEDIPLQDGCFDLVMSTLVMHHLPPEVKRPGMTEVYRVLKPGGRFVAVDLQLPETTASKLIGHLFLGHHMAAADITDSVDPLREAGFESVETGPTPNSWFACARGVKGVGPSA